MDMKFLSAKLFRKKSNTSIAIMLVGLFYWSSGFTQTHKFDSILTVFQKQKNFSGTVLLGDKGKISWMKSFGLANRAEKISISNQSIFKLASITKTFTATIILQLMDEGKIDLNKTIGYYLPEYTGEAKNRSTIHHLLTYSSGMENLDQYTEEMYAIRYPLDTLIKKYCSGKLVYEPGTRMDYKNAEYIILGKIIERITGKSFAVVLQEKILSPLKMKRAGFLRNQDIIPGLVNYYWMDSTGKIGNDDPYWIENFYTGGAMYSNITDLYQFDQALFTGKLLKKETLALMMTSYQSLYSVAYSFWVTEQSFGTEKKRIMDRRGSLSGVNTAWYHSIDDNKTIIVLGKWRLGRNWQKSSSNKNTSSKRRGVYHLLFYRFSIAISQKLPSLRIV
jgi:teichoic acid D-alanine hydrolase